MPRPARNRQRVVAQIEAHGGLPDALDINLKLSPTTHTQWMWGQLAAKLVRIGVYDELRKGGHEKKAGRELTADEMKWNPLADLMMTMAPDVGTSTNINPAMDEKIFGPKHDENWESKLDLHERLRPELAPTDAKASCHYPNSSRAIIDARDRGFDNPVMRDALGHVAEFATANIWIVRDGVAITPVPNGSFLNGITRQRLIQLMRDDGIEVQERTVEAGELLEADEIFNSGNYGKVQPVIQYEDRRLQPGPIYRRARELYWDFAHSGD